MFKKLILTFFILASLVFSVTAVNSEIFLSGTVKNNKDTPILGAKVMLASDTLLYDTTDSEGKFTIATTVIKKRYQTSEFNSINLILKGRVLILSVPLLSNITISIFSCNGKKCFTNKNTISKDNEYKVMLPELGTGIYILSINVDKNIINQPVVKYKNWLLFGNSKRCNYDSYSSSVSASAEHVDTLIVEKSGFAIVKYLLSSYKESDIVIVMNPEQVYGYGATVENTCEDCVVSELPDPSRLTVKNSKLPDPFKRIDGSRITKKSEWHCRRQEILRQAMKYIYGEKPLRPQVITGSVTTSKISVHVEENGKKIDFSATVKLPSQGQPPYPAIISVGSFGGLLMGESKILNEGVAVIYYDYSKIGKEKPDASDQIRKTDKQGFFYDIYGGKHSAGLLMAWAWGASRIIDVLQEYGKEIIDYRRLGVTGCSRTAKGAFTIALFDERIALALPEETSVGGVPAYRIADAKCPENTTNNFNGQEWLSDNFRPFVNNTALLPIDAHELIATIAPRGIYIMENPSATQMCAQGGHMATLAAMEVFKALGCPQNLSYNSNTPAGTGHCSYTSNFTDMLIKNITKFLKHQTAETGGIGPGSGTLNKADWIDWTAPTLEDDTDLYKIE